MIDDKYRITISKAFYFSHDFLYSPRRHVTLFRSHSSHISHTSNELEYDEIIEEVYVPTDEEEDLDTSHPRDIPEPEPEVHVTPDASVETSGNDQHSGDWNLESQEDSLHSQEEPSADHEEQDHLDEELIHQEIILQNEKKDILRQLEALDQNYQELKKASGTSPQSNKDASHDSGSTEASLVTQATNATDISYRSDLFQGDSRVCVFLLNAVCILCPTNL